MAFLQEFKRRADALDLGALADLCETLVAHTDELAVILLHVAPQELLGPVRHVLDVVAHSRDDSSASLFQGPHDQIAHDSYTDDSIAIERCGKLVNFLQIVVNRFEVKPASKGRQIT